MKKRILSILLLCCMVLTLLPVTAFAAGELRDSANVTVTFDSNGGSAVEPQSVPQGQPAQRPADPVKEGYTFIGWYDKNDLDNKYYNMPEWNFRYSVTKDMVLVAQWMEPMPISTEPITYLDKDGNQQVCNKYTVLTSNTAGSILDLTDKWYDLPAGWYVVKGDVTITPRLDTHGAVNLILNGYGYHLPDRIIKPSKMVQTPKAGVLFLWVCRDSREAAQGVQPLVVAKPPYRSAGKSPCAEISPRQSAHARKGV